MYSYNVIGSMVLFRPQRNLCHNLHHPVQVVARNKKKRRGGGGGGGDIYQHGDRYQHNSLFCISLQITTSSKLNVLQ